MLNLCILMNSSILFGTSKMLLNSHPIVLAAVRSKAMVLLLLIQCLLCWGCVFGPCFVFQYFMSF